MNEIYEIILSDITQPIWENWYIKEYIGEGNFSKVYKIEAERFGRKDVSALKIEPIVVVDELFFNEEQKKNILDRKRLLVKNESDIMYALRDCPYIVRYQEEIDKELYINGNFEGYYFLLKMELLTPVSKLIIDKKMDFSEQNIIKLAKNIGQGIKAAHDKGFIHRDIKPANLFVSDEGVYKLGDFNVSKKNVTARSVTGSGGYMAPEIFRINSDDSYTRQADIYSFGICLYQFMNNMYFPFEEKGKIYTDAAIAKRMKGERFPKPENSSEEFGRIILKACEFDTSKRYKTIDEMLFDLENINSFSTAENNVESEEPIETNNTDNYATEYTGDYIDNNVTEYAGDETSVKEDTDATQYAGEYYPEEDNITSVCEETENECCYTYDESADESETDLSDVSYETNDSDFEIEDGTLIKYHGNSEYVTIPDTITEIGVAAFWGCNSLISITIPNSVTEIGVNAFYGCKSLTSVTIPDSITKIDGNAFGHCYRLALIQVAENNLNYVSVNGILFSKDMSELVIYPGGKNNNKYIIPDSVTKIEEAAFYGCRNLTSVTIPNSVMEIGKAAFWECNSLTSITIPDNVTKIEGDAFGRCYRLALIQVSKNNLNYISVNGIVFSKDMSELVIYPGGKNDNKYIIPDSVTKIGGYAFWGCNSLTSITIPNSVTEIGESVFGFCKSLTSITIPNSVTEIGESVFGSCKSLTSINIPNSVTKIGKGAFWGCDSLTSVIIPHSVIEIEEDAFNCCESLTSVTIPDSVTKIGKNAFWCCDNLTSVTIPHRFLNDINRIFGYGSEKVIFSCEIKDNTLIRYHGNAEYVKIPDAVKEIGFGAFFYCKRLTSITIPNSVTKIDSIAFEKCERLNSITIPDSVIEIGNKAFKGCKSLTSVTIPRRFENDIDRIFPDCSKIVISYTEPKEESKFEEENEPKEKKIGEKFKKMLKKIGF